MPTLKVFLGKGGGDLTYLHTDAVDMSRFGKKRVQRASDVEFNEGTQKWQARLNNGEVIAESEIRQEVLDAERVYIDSLLEKGEMVPGCV